jgi:DMSO/TMAO reductase YedYZ molybdopterin-dependent catalytic subunit
MVPLSDTALWRYTKGQPPQIDYDYRRLKIRFDARGLAAKSGTLTFADLEGLPRQSRIFLLQCGAPTPRGIVKWTGVQFADVARMLGVQPFAHYCRFVGSDKYWTDEDMKTLMHPQVMLVWMMNDEPLAPKHGAPLRLIIPFRYGAHSVKAISEMLLHSTGTPLPPAPPTV